MGYPTHDQACEMWPKFSAAVLRLRSEALAHWYKQRAVHPDGGRYDDATLAIAREAETKVRMALGLYRWRLFQASLLEVKA